MKKTFSFLLLLSCMQCMAQQFTSYESARWFFFMKLRYPPKAIDSEYTGKVIFSVVIKSGEIKSSQTIFSAHPLLEASAKAVLDSSKKMWGFVDEETVLQIPFEFSISRGWTWPITQREPALAITSGNASNTKVMQPIPVDCVILCEYLAVPPRPKFKYVIAEQ